MDQEAPFDAHYESECQRRLAGYSSQVAAYVADWHALLKAQFGVKIQFGHDNKPLVLTPLNYTRSFKTGGLTKWADFEPKQTGIWMFTRARSALIPGIPRYIPANPIKFPGTLPPTSAMGPLGLVAGSGQHAKQQAPLNQETPYGAQDEG